MATVDPAPSRSSIPAGPVLGAVITVGTILLLGALVPAGESPRGTAAAAILITEGWPAAIWLLAALGLGSGLLRLLDAGRGDAPDPVSKPTSFRLAWPLGIALLILIDSILGSLGGLGRGRHALAWALVLVPAIPGAIVLGRDLLGRPSSRSIGLGLSLSIPIGVLLTAAATTPGWLWTTEFGGYDALSYHLQLPREWWFAGGIVETPHNAYGYLPGGMSAAFLHLMTLTGDPSTTGVSSQCLAAGTTIIAAIATGQLAVTILGDDSPTGRIVGMIGLLATPWVIVTGSLAYDEAAVILLTAAATTWLIDVADRPGITASASTGIAVGLLLGTAVLVKASSGILVVLPLAVFAAILIPPRRWMLIALATGFVGFASCLPWLVRNLAWTGNPVFPFAAGIFGQGAWTTEQIARFATAHASDSSLTANLAALVHEFLLEDLLGGSAAGETTRPQWLWLPIVGFSCLGWSMVRDEPRRRIVLALAVALATMVLAWMFGTHGKARFLLPAAPLLAAAVGVALARPAGAPVGRYVIGILAWCAAIGPVAIHATEREGRPALAIDAREAFNGGLEARMLQSADPGTAAEMLQDASRAFVLGGLPTGARIVLLGVADPWHVTWTDEEGRRLEYSTVWTRGPIEQALAAIPVDVDSNAAASDVIEALRNQGTTHLLISPTMLEVWARSGWLDPTLEPDRVKALTTAAGTRVVHRFQDDGILLAIEELPKR